MLAVRFHRFGDPAVLQLEHVAQPRPRADEVLVRVAASSLNSADLAARQGHTRLIHARRMPMIPGYDIAGEIVACGPQVTAFVPGEQVFGLVGLGAGGNAEYICVAQRKLARVPASISLVDAAAVPLAGLTALQGLRKHGRARAGQRVLVVGASGGVGTFAVQLASALGCRVAAVCSASKQDAVAGLGADELIERAELDDAIRGRQWDVIFDASGVQEFTAMWSALAPTGTLVGTRGSPANLLAAARSRLVGGPRFTFFVTAANGHDLALLARLIDRDALRPVIDRRFALADISEAHRYAESGNTRGKILVQVSPDEASFNPGTPALV